MSLDAVAFDGPAGSGKSTVARQVAAKLSWIHLDTGAMYRAVTYAGLSQGLDLSLLSNNEKVVEIAKNCQIKLLPGGQVFLDNQDVTDAIRTSQLTANICYVAANQLVRDVMTQKQRQIAQVSPCVAEGRDITTVVLPDAKWRYFITASVAVRTERRAKELESRGEQVDYIRLSQEIECRDQNDFNVGPLAESYRQAQAGQNKPGTIHLLDTSRLSVNEVVNMIVAAVKFETA